METTRLTPAPHEDDDAALYYAESECGGGGGGGEDETLEFLVTVSAEGLGPVIRDVVRDGDSEDVTEDTTVTPNSDPEEVNKVDPEADAADASESSSSDPTPSESPRRETSPSRESASFLRALLPRVDAEVSDEVSDEVSNDGDGAAAVTPRLVRVDIVADDATASVVVSTSAPSAPPSASVATDAVVRASASESLRLDATWPPPPPESPKSPSAANPNPAEEDASRSPSPVAVAVVAVAVAPPPEEKAREPTPLDAEDVRCVLYTGPHTIASAW